MLPDLRKTRSLLALALACASVVMLAPSTFAATPPKFPWEAPPIRVKPGRLIVTFESGVAAAQRSRIHGEVGSRPVRSTLRSRASSVDVVELPAGLPASAAIRAYEAEPGVVAVEPDRFAVPTEIPNDTHFAKQWNLRNVGQSHPMTESGYVGQTTPRAPSMRTSTRTRRGTSRRPAATSSSRSSTTASTSTIQTSWTRCG